MCVLFLLHIFLAFSTVLQNPTLQAIYPLASTLNIIRTLQPGLTPIPNTTTFGSAGSVYAQLFYAGVEQFYCHADSCTQDLGNGDGGADWTCQNLQCTCRRGTTFCGGVTVSDLTKTINALSGTLEIDCGVVDNSTNTATCHFKQATLQTLFGSSGLALNGCVFGECIRQGIIDNTGNSTTSSQSDLGGKSLSGGVIAGLAVVCGLVFLALMLLLFGYTKQRAARQAHSEDAGGSKVNVEWDSVSYAIPIRVDFFGMSRKQWNGGSDDISDAKVVLDSVSGMVNAGQMMAILGPSGTYGSHRYGWYISKCLGAGKTTLVEILARKNKSGLTTGSVKFLTGDGSLATPRIGFVPQQDVLPPTLTVYEALLFAARLRLPESIPDADKRELVDELMSKLGISSLRDVRIGHSGDLAGGKARGISGGEMRRVSIGVELIARPDVLILDEPTSGLSICAGSFEFVRRSLSIRSRLRLCFSSCASSALYSTRPSQSHSRHYFHTSAEVCPLPHNISFTDTQRTFIVRSYTNPSTRFSSWHMAVRSIQGQGYSGRQTILRPLPRELFPHTRKDTMSQITFWRSQAIRTCPCSSSNKSRILRLGHQIYRRRLAVQKVSGRKRDRICCSRVQKERGWHLGSSQSMRQRS